MASLSEDPARATYDFALRLYDSADGANQVHVLIPPVEDAVEPSHPVSPVLRRALTLMQSLAPRRSGANGYAPAHRFLAEFWKSRIPKNDRCQTLALQHEMFAAPGDANPALMLADFISHRGYHQQAIQILVPHHPDNSDVLLKLSAICARANDSRQAIRWLRLAEPVLQKTLLRNPDHIDTRLELSRVVAAQGRMLESVFLLAEGCRSAPSDALTNQLTKQYVRWLAMMSQEASTVQLEEIALALSYSPEWDAKYALPSTHSLDISPGLQVSLPGPVVALHAALLNGEGVWLAPLLLGTDSAAKSDFLRAAELLQQASLAAPDHPVVANNLAWTLLQLATARDSSDASKAAAETPETATSETLVRAWQQAGIAVAACPDNLSFLETRGLIAVATSRWDIAARDLKTCVDGGKHSDAIRRAMLQIKELSPQALDRCYE
ncbi:MAG: hypothetical protein R3C59_24685 [Planctomycetaceae bacterium]